MQSTVELGLGIARLVEVGTDGGKNTDRGTWDPANIGMSPQYLGSDIIRPKKIQCKCNSNKTKTHKLYLPLVRLPSETLSVKKLLVLLVLSPKYTTASGQKENNGFEFSRRN